MATREQSKVIFTVIAIAVFAAVAGCGDGAVPAAGEVDLAENQDTFDFSNIRPNLHEDPNDIINEIVEDSANLKDLGDLVPGKDIDPEIFKKIKDGLLGNIEDNIGHLSGKAKADMIELVKEMNPKEFVEIEEDYMIEHKPDKGDPSPLDYDADEDKLTQQASLGSAAVVNPGSFAGVPFAMKEIQNQP